MTNIPAEFDDLEVFCGETSHMVSRVYVRVKSLWSDDGWRLSGRVRGPLSAHGSTLPTTVALSPLAEGDSLLARATIADPCFWTPDTPLRYEARVDLHQRDQLVANRSLEFAVPSLAVRRSSLAMGGRRWVLRGASVTAVTCHELADWRTAVMAMVVPHPDENLCADASQLGVMVVARIGGRSETIANELRRMSRWGAVGLAIVDGARIDFEELPSASPNVLLGQQFSCDQPVEPASWCQVVLGNVRDPRQFTQQFGECKLPVVAVRDYDGKTSVQLLRAECDRLQRDLAPNCDCAGYLV